MMEEYNVRILIVSMENDEAWGNDNIFQLKKEFNIILINGLGGKIESDYQEKIEKLEKQHKRYSLVKTIGAGKTTSNEVPRVDQIEYIRKRLKSAIKEPLLETAKRAGKDADIAMSLELFFISEARSYRDIGMSADDTIEKWKNECLYKSECASVKIKFPEPDVFRSIQELKKEYPLFFEISEKTKPFTNKPEKKKTKNKVIIHSSHRREENKRKPPLTSNSTSDKLPPNAPKNKKDPLNKIEGNDKKLDYILSGGRLRSKEVKQAETRLIHVYLKQFGENLCRKLNSGNPLNLDFKDYSKLVNYTYQATSKEDLMNTFTSFYGAMFPEEIDEQSYISIKRSAEKYIDLINMIYDRMEE